MPCDDRDRIEIQVIADVLDAVDTRLRERERHGWRLTVPRSHVYALVLHAVIRSARAHSYRGTLDAADILDAIFDGAERPVSGGEPVEDAIRKHTVHVN
ncbi:hypothetical protein [Nocardia seriolae]|nr:hypothetical protein [Nocardia seriolae]APB00570.1 hypothetical protein NS506_06537 [Nocardia seriolae]MTJ61936.1 hypothetical protein [Nocardia seriolae]MTJ76163.1 hypothetical protein [Nocardia seriolae]MTJ90036.1 hypothetical protein [Nocardia seriolae]MTK34009.1 hypothetical protein [Nocardia seriolae]